MKSWAEIYFIQTFRSVTYDGFYIAEAYSLYSSSVSFGSIGSNSIAIWMAAPTVCLEYL